MAKDRMCKKPTEAAKKAVVTLPLAEIDDAAYLSQHVEAQLTRVQARALRQVFNALRKEAALLTNGRYVQSMADTVRWILEQIGAQSE